MKHNLLRQCCAGLLLSASLLGAKLIAATPQDGGERRILQARDAATRGDVAQLEQMFAQASWHPLEPYVGYWLYSAKIAKTTEALPLVALRDYLNANAGAFLAERLRSDWLKRLGRESNWSVFNEEYARLQQPEPEVQCWAIRARHPNSESLLQNLDTQWLSLSDTPESCFIPLQMLVESGRKKADDVRWRLRRLVEANRLAAARHAASLLPEGQALDSAGLGRAFDNPERYLATAPLRSTAAREVALAALARLARRDARAAIAAWRGLDEGQFSANERAYAAAQLGWGAAMAQLSEANNWFIVSRQLVSELPMGAEQAAWQVRAALRVRDWRSVQASIERMPDSLRSAPEWTYWLARAYAAQNQAGQAQALYQRYAGEPNFYGILSAEALGRSLVWPTTAAPVKPNELQQAEASADMQRTLALLNLDLRTEALREFNWGLRMADDRFLLAVAELMRRNGHFDRAISAADRTKVEHDYGFRYPAPYYPVFAQAAQRSGLDLYWLYGLTRQESRFVVSARSSVGAQGLMQVMPATGRMVAKQLGMTDYVLSETETNVRIGTAYLKSVLNSLSNAPVMATAAYNAGPGRAKRWRDSKPLEGAIYAETIPFTETRDYVKKVLANAVAYAVLLSGKPESLTRLLGTVPASVPGEAPLLEPEVVAQR